jgi:hypothetical protein
VSDDTNEVPTTVELDVTVDSTSDTITHVTLAVAGSAASIEVHIPRGMSEEDMAEFQGVADHLADILDGLFHSLNVNPDADGTVVIAV